MSLPSIKSLFFTFLALLAFAGNSVLCRLALGDDAIDAASFTVIRLLSGAIFLWILCSVRRGCDESKSSGSWLAALLLFLYALTFSFAYRLLDTGIGALVLFGTVQIMLVSLSVASGYRLRVAEWCGLLLALMGFVYLIWPSLVRSGGDISIVGFSLMVLSGLAWGGYTVLGKGSNNALKDTMLNFTKALPFVALLCAVFLFQSPALTVEGVLLAVFSGSIASGLGYAIWYAALGDLSGIQAAVCQLLVPVIAAVGGVLFSNEIISTRLLLASVCVLGGVLMIILSSSNKAN